MKEKWLSKKERKMARKKFKRRLNRHQKARDIHNHNLKIKALQRQCIVVETLKIHNYSKKLTRSFLSSIHWIELKKRVFSKIDKKCMRCGKTRLIHVDHIVPISFDPKLCLSVKNLQVLCARCNYEKSNTDQTDYRDCNNTNLIYSIDDSDLIDLWVEYFPLRNSDAPLDKNAFIGIKELQSMIDERFFEARPEVVAMKKERIEKMRTRAFKMICPSEKTKTILIKKKDRLK